MTEVIAPPDLRLHITTASRYGRTQLTYRLDSPSGVVNVTYEEIPGPELRSRPEEVGTELLQRLKDLAGGHGLAGEMLLRSEIDRKIDNIGRELYQALFPPAMQQAYRSFRESVRTILIVSDEPWIPWEIIKPYDDSESEVIDDDFLCIRFELTRWLSSDATPASTIKITRIANIILDPHIPKIAEELTGVRAITRAHPQIQDLSLGNPTFSELIGFLEEGGVGLFHFLGTAGDSEIPLTDGVSLRPEDFQGLIRTRLKRDRPLIFMNGSNTGRAAWAERLIRVCGCGAFVGPRWNISNAAAREFAICFYDSLARGKTFGEACKASRLRIHENRPGDPAWLAFSIYAHPNGRIEPPSFSSSTIPSIAVKKDAIILDTVELDSTERASHKEFYSCFISYSHADQEFVLRLESTLRKRGVDCWFDLHDLLPGDDLHEGIDQAIKIQGKILLCCSQASLSSIWVDREIDMALQKEERLWKELKRKTLAIIPLDLDGFIFRYQGGKASYLKSRLAADFTTWRDEQNFGREFERLLAALLIAGRKPAG